MIHRTYCQDTASPPIGGKKARGRSCPIEIEFLLLDRDIEGMAAPVEKMPIMKPRIFPILVVVLLATVSGCVLTGSTTRLTAPAEVRNARLQDVSQKQPVYEPLDPQMITLLKDALRKSCAVRQTSHLETKPPVNVLAISGGGSYGAFDVGVLHGWSASGTRPTFDVVTGISTGAFIATFAFLGPKYDELIRDLYTNARVEDVYETRTWLSILSSDSVASSKPLRKKIEATFTPQLLQEVADAHAKGRRLYVGTTDLDTRRFVIWDMGAIASSGKPDALDLYRKIILASGSVPGFFPPVLIDVDVDGQRYQELHVDGGATASVFVPMAMTKCDPHKPCARPGSNVFVICSGKLYADSDTVRQRFVSITVDSISAMLYAGCRGDIFRIFNMALLCGMDFHLIAVPQEFVLNPNSLDIQPEELRRLYQLGYEMGKTRKGWRTTPPGTEVDEQALPRTGTMFRTQSQQAN